jgi:predicted dehydrogenase
MKTVRVGIIGIGNMGSAHTSCIARGEIDGLIITALCDVNTERCEMARERYPNISVFQNYKELLESGLTDAVIIATPHYEHPIIAIDAFRAGNHVLTEKPAGVSASHVSQMNKTAMESGKIFAIMFQQRTHPLYKKAKEIIETGRLGKRKRLVWIATNWYRTQEYYDSGSWRATWRGEGGGVLLNQAPHNLDLLQWLFGIPKSIYAVCREGKYHNIEVEDETTIYAEYEDGATATFITTTGEYPGSNRLEISGEQGKLVLEEGCLKWWDLGDDVKEKMNINGGMTERLEPTYILRYPQTEVTGHGLILQNFTDAIRFGTTLIARGEEGINSLSISNAAYLSSWTKSEVNLPIDQELFDTILAEKVKHSVVRETKKLSEFTDGYRGKWNVNW